MSFFVMRGMNGKVRLVISLLFAFAVGGLSLEATRAQMEHSHLAFPGRFLTELSMSHTTHLIEDVRARKHRLPVNIAEAERSDADASDGYDRDAWNRPLVYVVNGSTFVLLSYGSDGTPGGRAEAADIRSDRLKVWPRLGYRDLVSMRAFPEILGWTFVTMGAIGFGVWYGLRKEDKLTPGTVVGLIVVGAVAAVMSGFMTMIHVFPDH